MLEQHSTLEMGWYTLNMSAVHIYVHEAEFEGFVIQQSNNLVICIRGLDKVSVKVKLSTEQEEWIQSLHENGQRHDEFECIL